MRYTHLVMPVMPFVARTYSFPRINCRDPDSPQSTASLLLLKHDSWLSESPHLVSLHSVAADSQASPSLLCFRCRCTIPLSLSSIKTVFKVHWEASSSRSHTDTLKPVMTRRLPEAKEADSKRKALIMYSMKGGDIITWLARLSSCIMDRITDHAPRLQGLRQTQRKTHQLTNSKDLERHGLVIQGVSF